MRYDIDTAFGGRKNNISVSLDWTENSKKLARKLVKVCYLNDFLNIGDATHHSNKTSAR